MPIGWDHPETARYYEAFCERHSRYGDANAALIAAALSRVLTDETERTRILTAARDTLARYSWRRCAERVLEVLLECSD